MKMKKNLRRMLTLRPGTADGFTLIELIVTVAIIAVLGGVGVPAYSGYVEKANKQADISLASDVAQALSLAYYNQKLPNGGYVTLTTEKPTASSPEVEAAMVAAFGEGWDTSDSMKLKYDGWTIEGNTTAVALKQGFFAAAVPNSSYLTGGTTTSLLKNVTDLTTAASDLLTDMDATVKYSTIHSELFGNDATAFKDACDKFGIDVSEKNGQPVFADSVTNAQLSNLLVFGAAQQISDGKSSAITNYVDTYSQFAAFANANPDNTELQNAYQTLNSTLMTDNTGDNQVGSADVEKAFNTFREAANTHGYENYTNSQNAQMDKVAFQQIMGAVSEASKGVSPEELSSADFFSTSEKVLNSFDNYVTGAEVIAGMETEDEINALSDSVKDGNITILINPNGPKVLSTCNLGE